MKYRISLIFLVSLLFASFSFNCLHYDAIIRAEKANQIDCEVHSKLREISRNRNEE